MAPDMYQAKEQKGSLRHHVHVEILETISSVTNFMSNLSLSSYYSIIGC